MIACERGEEEAGQLAAESLLEPVGRGRAQVLEAAERGAMLEEKVGPPPRALSFGGGVHLAVSIDPRSRAPSSLS